MHNASTTQRHVRNHAHLKASTPRLWLMFGATKSVSAKGLSSGMASVSGVSCPGVPLRCRYETGSMQICWQIVNFTAVVMFGVSCMA